MSQVILVRTLLGVVVASDTKTSGANAAHGFPPKFPKIFRVDGWIFGATGAAMMTQMLVDAATQVTSGALEAEQVVKELLETYENYVEQRRALVDLEIKAKSWSASLLCVAPNGDLKLYRDPIEAPTGKLVETKTAGNVIVLGPETNVAKKVQDATLATLPTLPSLEAVAAHLRWRIGAVAQTAEWSGLVGKPIVHLSKSADGVIVAGGDEEAKTTLVDSCLKDDKRRGSLVEWLVPGTVPASSNAKE